MPGIPYSLKLGAASSDRVVVAGPTPLGSQGWLAMWARSTNDATAQRWLNTTTAATDGEWITFRGDASPKAFRCFIQRSTTYWRVFANFTAFSAWAVNEWVFIAIRFDMSLTNADQQILVGNLSTPASEPSSYVTQDIGSGTIASDAGDGLIIGNNPPFNSAMVGSIAMVAIGNQYPTLDALRTVQFHPTAVPPGCRGLWFPGQNGRGSVIDWSGNAHPGTITGAVPTSDNLPHIPMRRAS